MTCNIRKKNKIRVQIMVPSSQKLKLLCVVFAFFFSFIQKKTQGIMKGRLAVIETEGEINLFKWALLLNRNFLSEKFTQMSMRN